MDVAPFSVAMQMLSRTAREPLEKFSNSNTPTGPFQMTVLDLSMTAVKEEMLSGPTSSPIQSAGIPEVTLATPVYKQSDPLLSMNCSDITISNSWLYRFTVEHVMNST